MIKKSLSSMKTMPYLTWVSYLISWMNSKRRNNSWGTGLSNDISRD